MVDGTHQQSVDGLVGAALDAAIVECVMGWKAGRIFKRNHYQEFKDAVGEVWFVGGCPDPVAYECDHPEEQVFAPSSEIAAAMQVVEKLVANGMPWAVEIESQPQGWQVIFWDGSDPTAKAKAETLPLAICRAALKAVQAEKVPNGDL